jgi:two-component system sensor histidine kinase VicK
MHSASKTKKMGRFDNDHRNPSGLIETLNSAGIGTWTFDIFSRHFRPCDLAIKITGGVADSSLTVRSAMKLVAPAYLRKAYYLFYAGYLDHSLITLEFEMGSSEDLVEGKWLCLKGRYNPDKKEFSGLLYDITTQKICEMNTSVLVAKLSHELRGPLSTMKLYTQQCLKAARAMDSPIASFLEKSDNQIDRMNNLIEDLLFAATSEGKVIPLRKSNFLMEDLLETLIPGSFPCETAKRIILQTGEKHLLYADREKMIQVIMNYITNALKYSDETTNIIVATKTTGDNFLLSVQDFGIGVSTLEQKMIFQKYYRCRNVAAVPGHGIGLFVVREIIEAHAGTFGIHSKKNEGSTFYFTLPIER